MDMFRDRRVLAGVGAGVAAVLAVVAALALSRSPKGPDAAPAPVESSNMVGSAGGGGLKVEMGRAPKLESDTSVRCFVDGRFVGMQTAAACAGKNGVAPGALDVGLDQSGAIAAGGGDTRLAPMAQADPKAGARGDGADDSDDGSADDPTADVGGRGYATAPPAACRRFAGGGWRPAGEAVSLDTCVHTLFDGRCPPPGQVVYGHWGALSLRDSPGRIDVSADNHAFRPLAPQYPADCSIPSL